MTTHMTIEPNDPLSVELANEACNEPVLANEVADFKDVLKNFDCPMEENSLPDLFTLVSDEDGEEKEVSEAELALPIVFKNLLSPLFSSLEADGKICREEASCDQQRLPLFLSMPIFPAEPTSTILPLHSSLSPEVYQLFEKMAGAMILLNSSEMNETTLVLDSPQFSASPFFGTEVSIKEFSSAPKAYNVSLSSTASALPILQAHLPELLAAFEQGDFHFKVHRLETEIRSEHRPFFHRKQAASNQEQDLENDGRQ